MKNLTYDELELVREIACENCKGIFLGCDAQKFCDAWQAAIKEVVEEQNNGATD